MIRMIGRGLSWSSRPQILWRQTYSVAVRRNSLFFSGLRKRLFHSSTQLFAQDYYKILGVSRNATDAEIKAQYKKLAKQYHPDLNPQGADKFKEISAAYEVLSKPEKRRIYDMHGAEGVDAFNAGATGGSPGFDPFEIFQSAFGGDMFGFRGGRAQRPTQSPPVSYTLHVSLEDLFSAKTHSLSYRRNVNCHTCDGTGSKSKRNTQCPTCKGSGYQVSTRKVGPGMIQQIQQVCAACNGTGESVSVGDRCDTCRGEKIVSERANINIPIDPSIESGQQLVISGEGNKHPNQVPGDLIVTVEVNPHPVFKRYGDNLYIEENISLAQALCGSPVNIKHLDGRNIFFELKPGEIQPGTIKEIKNEGMPLSDSLSQRGNLYVKLNVLYPKPQELSKDVINTLSKVLNFDKETIAPASGAKKLDARDVPETTLSTQSTKRERKHRSGRGPKREQMECNQM